MVPVCRRWYRVLKMVPRAEDGTSVLAANDKHQDCATSLCNHRSSTMPSRPPCFLAKIWKCLNHCYNQVRSQNLNKGGLFWKSEKTANDLDPNFHCSWIRIKCFFSPKTGDLQKKKKVFTEIETNFSAKIGNSNALSGRITTSTSQFRPPIFFGGGLFSFFYQKSASKAPKTCDFAYFTGQWGARAPPGCAIGYNTKDLSSQFAT